MEWKPIDGIDFKVFYENEIILCSKKGVPVKYTIDPIYEMFLNAEQFISFGVTLQKLIKSGVTHYMKLEHP